MWPWKAKRTIIIFIRSNSLPVRSKFLLTVWTAKQTVRIIVFTRANGLPVRSKFYSSVRTANQTVRIIYSPVRTVCLSVRNLYSSVRTSDQTVPIIYSSVRTVRQTDIYKSIFPNSLTPKKTKNPKINVYFFTNTIKAACHSPPQLWTSNCAGFLTKHVVKLKNLSQV